MVGAYLRGSSSCIEELSELASTLATFLLSIYNLICGAIGTTSKTSLFSENGVIIPDILHSSVYHDTMLVSSFCYKFRCNLLKHLVDFY